MTVGTLIDSEIIAAAEKGELISEGFELKNVKQACYELTLGDVYFDLTDGNKRIATTKSNNAIIKPGHLVVLITKEKLNIPNDVFARLISKGSLFSLGLMPVSTYADPGFRGNIGIVTYNLSKNYVELPIGEPISKIEFSKLDKPVTEPYRGQHGFETGVWPIKSQFIKTYDQVKNDERVYSIGKEAKLALPLAFSKTIQSIGTHQRALYLMVVLLLTLNLIIIAFISKDISENIWLTIGLGVLTNIISSVIIWNATSLKS
jgi:dCTP deaminase